MLLILGGARRRDLTVGVSIELFFPNKDGVLAADCGANRTMILFAAGRADGLEGSLRRSHATRLDGHERLRARRVRDLRAHWSGPNAVTPEVIVTLTVTCQRMPGLSVDLGGGCVTYHSKLPAGTTGEPTLGDGISFTSRRELVDFVGSEDDQKLLRARSPLPVGRAS